MSDKSIKKAVKAAIETPSVTKFRGKTIDRELLVQEIFNKRIVDKMPTKEILAYLKGEGISERVGYEIIKDVSKKLVEMNNENAVENLALAIGRLEQLYYEAKAEKTKLTVLQEIHKLQGIYATLKVDTTVTFEAKFED